MQLKNLEKIFFFIIVTLSILVPSLHSVNVYATSYGSDDIDCNTHHNSMGGINHMGGTCEDENGGLVHFGGLHNTNTDTYHFHAGFRPG